MEAVRRAMLRMDHNLRGATPRFSDLHSDVDVLKWKIVTGK
jgi:hypothetical protein